MKAFIFSLALLGSSTLMAQHYGNVAYANQNNNYGNGRYNFGNQAAMYSAHDSVYTLGARVMINVQPDVYIAVYSVHQEGKTVQECSKAINSRVDKFKAALKGIKIAEEDIFVDMIAQTRIYDYEIEGATATETKEGFEFKKNVIVRFAKNDMLEKISLLAAEQAIFDLVKVDYIIYDIEKVENQLRDAALKVIENKKKFTSANSTVELAADKGVIVGENFNTVYPQEAYKQYAAAETATVQAHSYNNQNWIREERKSKTFYFEKVNSSGFDKVINADMVQVPVQMMLEFNVMYDMKKK